MSRRKRSERNNQDTPEADAPRNEGAAVHAGIILDPTATKNRRKSGSERLLAGLQVEEPVEGLRNLRIRIEWTFRSAQPAIWRLFARPNAEATPTVGVHLGVHPPVLLRAQHQSQC